MENNKSVNGLIVIAIGILCAFTYFAMDAIATPESASSIIAATKMCITLLAIYISQIVNVKKSELGRLFTFWCVWLLLEFTFFGNGGVGVANIFHVLFCPMCYSFFYRAAYASEKTIRYSMIGFGLIFLIALFSAYKFLTVHSINLVGNEMVVNIAFWFVAPLPFIFFLNKRWLQIVVLCFAMAGVLITGKRSPMIAIGLVSGIYLISVLKKPGKKVSTIIWVFVGIFVAVFLLSRYMSDSIDFMVERLTYTKGEDYGRGRDSVYKHILGYIMNDFSINQWLVGAGFGSIPLLLNESNAHNDALEMFFEYGIVGLIVFVRLLIIVVKKSVSFCRIKSPYAYCYLAATSIFLTFSTVSNMMTFASYFAYICVFWAIIDAKYDKGYV